MMEFQALQHMGGTCSEGGGGYELGKNIQTRMIFSHTYSIPRLYMSVSFPILDVTFNYWRGNSEMHGVWNGYVDKYIFKILTFAIVESKVLNLKDEGRTQAESFYMFVTNFCADSKAK